MDKDTEKRAAEAVCEILTSYYAAEIGDIEDFFPVLMEAFGIVPVPDEELGGWNFVVNKP